jgi:insertion element IS1 protein InsB
MGDRDTNTFKRLWDRISSIPCGTYFTDNWDSYKELIPRSKHVISKGETCVVESKNSQIRTYGSVFHRKTKCVSKSMEMINKQMLLVTSKINEIAMKKYEL